MNVFDSVIRPVLSSSEQRKNVQAGSRAIEMIALAGLVVVSARVIWNLYRVCTGSYCRQVQAMIGAVNYSITGVLLYDISRIAANLGSVAESPPVGFVISNVVDRFWKDPTFRSLSSSFVVSDFVEKILQNTCLKSVVQPHLKGFLMHKIS